MASNTQPQSAFFVKLPSEVRLSVYEYVLSDFRGKKSYRGQDSHLGGALSCCKQMNNELENEASSH
jgi:hypothetical protein